MELPASPVSEVHLIIQGSHARLDLLWMSAAWASMEDPASSTTNVTSRLIHVGLPERNVILHSFRVRAGNIPKQARAR